MRAYNTQANGKGRSDFFILVIGLFIVILNELSTDLFVEAGDKGDDIILHKGKIIMRGGKGKGNIILDPGSHSSEESHEMPPMMPMMGHFNPYSFYPMQNHHQHHEQHMMMPRPIYIEDHSAMHNHHHHEPEQHHQEHQQHHQEYHHEEPQHHHEENQQHHYEPQQQHHEMEHHQQYEPVQHHHHEMPHHEMQHHEPMHQYEHEGHESHDGHGDHHGYEHHPMMSMHGSGPQPIYQQQQQLATMQALQQPEIYAQLTPEQQAALYQHHQAQAMAAHQHYQQQQQQQQQEAAAANQQQNELQQGQGSNEVASQVSASGSDTSLSTPTAKPVSKVSALLQKSAAKNPLVQIIKPLFQRNKDQKESEKQKKP